MVDDRRAIELNEVRWWSKWARVRWRGDAYLMTSEGLREPFFNRAGALSCGAAKEAGTWADRELARLEVDPTVTLFDTCRETAALREAGYKTVDRMEVLELKSATMPAGGGSPAVTEDPAAWALTYLDSFYGERSLKRVVTPITARVARTRGVTLFESRVEGKMVGVMALYRTPGLLGLYCLGTVPNHRSRGVATGMVGKAAALAKKEHRRLVLQTLASDGALRFYLRMGFTRLHTKLMMERRLNGT